MTIRTPAFQSGQVIPAKYTCEGADISPPLQWTEVRAGAKSLSLIFDDLRSVLFLTAARP
jgi:phosphatidylethanolamine-binding protein (PEBP) family uncharacterized protein